MTSDLNRTISLSEILDDKFWEKVLFVEKWRSSGLGGAGALWIISSDKLLYQIGFETLPYDEHKLEQFNKFFEEMPDGDKSSRTIYKIEANGWTYLGNKGQVWIRSEYVVEFELQMDEAEKTNDFVFKPEIFAKIIGVEGELERVYEEKLAAYIYESQQEMARLGENKVIF